MVLAADYPFLDIFWTILFFFAWVIWIWMVVVILTDVFRRRDIGGWTKAAWTVFMIVVPFVGALAYLISQHDAMADRQAKQIEAQQTAIDSHIKSVAAADGPSTEIQNAKRLLDEGTIDEAEYQQLKHKALAAA
jgi:hypothetical protein